MNVYINTLQFNKSLVDGPGVRSLVFFQGCNIHCKGCHNKAAWEMSKGKKYEVSKLAEIIIKNSFNNKITITGGEPLMQKEALIELLKKLDGMDIAVYTGHDKKEVPNEVWKYAKYVKCGPFIEKLKTTIKPYVGSTNQEFISKEEK